MKGQRSEIAVIGAGVAGLTAAYLLSRQHNITIYERNQYFGGHTNTITISDGPDAGTRVDTGFIVFNDQNYPTFIRLLEQLGIQGQKSDMSFGFSSKELDLAYSSYVPQGLFAQKRNYFRPKFYQMIFDILRFNKVATSDLHNGKISEYTLGEYLRKGSFSDAFMNYYLLPMGAAIWSTPPNQMLGFPAETFLRFFDNHGLLALKGRPQWRSIPGGSKSYIEAMFKQISPNLKPQTEIPRVKRNEENVSVIDSKGEEKKYDYVVIGTHADEVLNVLSDPSVEEKNLLGAWTYTTNLTVLHTDASFMPWVPGAWASWNYTLEDAQSSQAPVSLTYHMNRLQNLNTHHQYFVTLNTQREIPQDKIIRKIHYTHPMYTFESLDSQEHLPKLNGVNRTFFCGSYFGYGFHEDAVKSGVEVAKHFGIRL